MFFGHIGANIERRSPRKRGVRCGMSGVVGSRGLFEGHRQIRAPQPGHCRANRALREKRSGPPRSNFAEARPLASRRRKQIAPSARASSPTVIRG
jgi:hypothetical protein